MLILTETTSPPWALQLGSALICISAAVGKPWNKAACEERVHFVYQIIVCPSGEPEQELGLLKEGTEVETMEEHCLLAFFFWHV